ncbi:hypothetical protein EYC80_000501 [Monilinia laxa]|uniref:Uncharacterized protein n=1 Tax=Monilinia laxa TaxID=61186 RepID=A0A5N6KAU0_MONLA|nr:hypothetical protein EYC80_000501 [Monilinia laxa]
MYSYINSRTTTVWSNSILQTQTQTQTLSESTQLFESFQASTASPRQLPTNKMSTITIVNNSTADVSVSVTYDGNDFQKGGSESWYTLKANGGSDTWNYRASNQVARVVRSKTAGTPVEAFLAVPGKTVYIN